MNRKVKEPGKKVYLSTEAVLEVYLSIKIARKRAVKRIKETLTIKKLGF